ncbi:hypothetical protein, partial [Propionivibrio sp.]|uniref:hypothetical protein n=1 Tax=Propionivibrio sp. TaxID=2212460 RepID=UPI003BEF53A8
FSKPKDNDPVQELYPHPAPPVCKSQIKRLYVQMCGEGFPETDNVIREDREFLAHYSASLDAFFELDREASILIGGTRIHDRGEAAMKEFFAEGGEAEKMISGLDVIPTTMIVKQDRAPEGYVLVPINPAKDALKKCEAMVKMQQMYCSPEDLYAMFIEAAKEKP